MMDILYNIFCTRIGYYLIRYWGFEGSSYASPPHSIVQEYRVKSNVTIIPVPCLASNYAYVLVDRQVKQAVVIDPSSHVNVTKALPEGVQVKAILCTHKHWDHIAGVYTLCEEWKGIDVWVHSLEKFNAATKFYAHDDVIQITPNLTFKIVHVPGHTFGSSLLIYSPSPESTHVFTGDAIFSHGLGRFFEGSPATLIPSLKSFLTSLPNTALFWPGHEYAANNTEFLHKHFPTIMPTDKFNAVVAKRRQREALIPLDWPTQQDENVLVRTAIGNIDNEWVEKLDPKGEFVASGKVEEKLMERMAGMRAGFVSSFHL